MLKPEHLKNDDIKIILRLTLTLKDAHVRFGRRWLFRFQIFPMYGSVEGSLGRWGECENCPRIMLLC